MKPVKIKAFPGFLLAVLSIVLFIFPALQSAQATEPIDWSVKVVDSTMTRSPRLTGWGYWNGFYLSAMYRVWQRTKNEKYLQYIKSWADSCLDDSGEMKTAITSLDLIQPGLVLLYLYEQTGLEKYKLAATKIRAVYDTYPRTADGGLWHMTKGTAANFHLGIGELWADGAFMGTGFLMKYGALLDDAKYCNDEATKQLIVYANHLQDPETGLLFHAYDEDGSEPWADKDTRHSKEFWGRSIGWYGMALIETLELLPENHPKRPEILAILKNLVAGLVKYQDSETGLWYQVVNKGDHPGNWLESSCSCMYTYVISKGVERGYVGADYAEYAQKGYQGVLSKIFLGANGLAYLEDISQGTDVGDYSYYINRERRTNDLHGLGAFLVCNEQLKQ